MAMHDSRDGSERAVWHRGVALGMLAFAFAFAFGCGGGGAPPADSARFAEQLRQIKLAQTDTVDAKEFPKIGDADIAKIVGLDQVIRVKLETPGSPTKG